MELGLTSVTFRNRTCQEILHYCKECGLTWIEWGSDVHVPQTGLDHAKTVAAATRRMGIHVSSYGSYYSLCEHDNWPEAFLPYLKTAAVLNAPVIRIWSGYKSAVEASQEYYDRAVRETRELCDMAEKYGIMLAYEYHDHSLSDTGENAVRIARDIDRKNFSLYFQYDSQASIDENIRSLYGMLPYVSRVHVAYQDRKRNAMFLEEGEGTAIWKEMVRMLRSHHSKAVLLFEFLKEASLEGLMRQTQVMRSLMEEE